MNLEQMEVKLAVNYHVPAIPIHLLSPSHPLAAMLRACHNSHLPLGSRVTIRFLEVQPGAYEVDLSRGRMVATGYEEKGEETFSLSELRQGERLVAILREKTAAGLDAIVCNAVVNEDSDTTYFVPMVDFHSFMKVQEPGTKAPDIKETKKLMKQIGLDISSFVFFDSGRSFHAYGQGVMGMREHTQFLARLLLLPHGVVDTRWVGHSLARESANLRWTCTSRKYLQAPTLVANPFA